MNGGFGNQRDELAWRLFFEWEKGGVVMDDDLSLEYNAKNAKRAFEAIDVFLAEAQKSPF